MYTRYTTHPHCLVHVLKCVLHFVQLVHRSTVYINPYMAKSQIPPVPGPPQICVFIIFKKGLTVLRGAVFFQCVFLFVFVLLGLVYFSVVLAGLRFGHMQCVRYVSCLRSRVRTISICLILFWVVYRLF